VSKDDELVYALPREVAFGAVAPWLGVARMGVEPILDLISGSGRYVRRGDAEHDPSLKQIIPYMVLRDGERVFLMKRTRGGGDSRLHDLYTIGVGGHMNPPDEGSVSVTLLREWNEEICADFEPDFRFVGLLNDDTVDVGLHHLGVVYEADAAGRDVAIRETDKLSGGFATLQQARMVYDRMETWSQLAFDAICAGSGSEE
jgi:predicted NUDIX family phosphoesterase